MWASGMRWIPYKGDFSLYVFKGVGVRKKREREREKGKKEKYCLILIILKPCVNVNCQRGSGERRGDQLQMWRRGRKSIGGRELTQRL